VKNTGKTYPMKAGQACVIDREMGEYTIKAASAKAQVFVVSEPSASHSNSLSYAFIIKLFL